MGGKWSWIASLSLILALVLAGVWYGLRHRPAAAERTPGAALLATSLGSSFVGKVRPQHVVNFGAEVDGTIESFLADVGDEVFTGQSLAHIASSPLEGEKENAATAVDRSQDRVDKAESAVDNARLEQSRASADLERSRVLLGEAERLYDLQSTRIKVGAIPRLTFEKAEKDYNDAQQDTAIKEKAYRTSTELIDSLQKVADTARADLAAKQQALEDASNDLDATEVRSPVDGIIAGRNGQIGDAAAAAGDQMFQVATDMAAMEAVIEPPPPALKKIYPGMPAIVILPESSNAAFAGQVKSVEGTEVVVEFVNSLPFLRSGARADVRIKLD